MLCDLVGLPIGMHSFDQSGHARRQWTGHRGAAQRVVILLGAIVIHLDMIGGHGGENGDAGRGDIHPIAVIGERGLFVAAIGGRHSQHMRIGRRVRGAFAIVIACRGHHQHIVIIGVIDGVPHRIAIGAAAQTEIDDVGVMIDGMDDALGHGVHGGAAGIIREDLHGHQTGAPARAADALAIVARCADDPGHMRAMSIGVGRIIIILAIVIPGVGGRQTILEIRMPQIHARIDDGHHHAAAALGHIPRPRAIHLLQRPLIAVLGVVGPGVE